MSTEQNRTRYAIAYAKALVGDFTPAQRAAIAAQQIDRLTTEQVCELVDALVAPDDTEKALAIVRQSLIDQAAARLDPEMPLLKPEVVAGLRETAEAQYALAETEEERIESHGLSMLCDWQDRARAARTARTAAA